MKRIPFGKEKKLEIIAATCPGCDASYGQYHEYGCVLESCPQCNGRLVKCSCMVLSTIDEFKMTKAIAKTLTRGQVHRMTQGSKTLDHSYEEMGAFLWITQNASPEMKNEIDKMVTSILSGEKVGDMMFVPLNKAAEALGMSEEEAEPIMRELEAENLYPGWADNGVEEKQ